jgi:hypothetical protein
MPRCGTGEQVLYKRAAGDGGWSIEKEDGRWCARLLFLSKHNPNY